MGSIAERFQEYLKVNGIAKQKAEAELGLGNGTLSKMFERNSSIKSGLLEKIQEKYPDFDISLTNSDKKDPTMDQSREIQLLEREIKALHMTIDTLRASVRRLEGSEALEQAKATIKSKDDQIVLLKKEIEEKEKWKGMTLKEVSSGRHKTQEKG